MYALRMIGDYIEELLEGIKSWDARAYPTSKRGTIALMDTKTKRVLGYVDLVGVREISEKEYCDWHATGKYSGLTLTIPEEKRSPHYYAYDFENPRFEPHPYNISPKEGERVWVYIGEPNLQGTLF